MRPTLRGRLLLALAMTVPCGIGGAQMSVEDVQRLIASDGAGGVGGFDDPGDSFGSTLSICGDTAVIGALFHDSLGIESSGAAYVFQWNGTDWVEAQKLVSSIPEAWGVFGGTCAIMGDTMVVGAPGESSGGAVHVFVRQGGQWAQEALVLGDSGFGGTLDLDGDSFVTRNNELVEVFVRAGSTWSRQVVLDPGDTSSGDCYGCSVRISGDVVVVGSRWDDHTGLHNAGTAYVFERAGSLWTQTATLTSTDADDEDLFGSSVYVSGDVIVVGAPSESDLVPSAGAAYVFRRSRQGWYQEAKLRLRNPHPADSFGSSVSVSGDVVVGGATGGSIAGVFVHDGASWEESFRLSAFEDPAPGGDYFGHVVRIDGNHILVGAPHDEPQGNDSGAAYLYRITRRAGTATCFGANCPCGNADPTAGCANSTGVGGFLVGTGSRSVSCENGLQFTATQLPQPTSGLLYMGDTAIAAPLLDGIQCAGGTTFRLTGLMQTVDGAGAITFGPGVLDASGAVIDPGETWHFQAFYRDAGGSPCGTAANLTNAYSVTFLP